MCVWRVGSVFVGWLSEKAHARKTNHVFSRRRPHQHAPLLPFLPIQRTHLHRPHQGSDDDRAIKHVHGGLGGGQGEHSTMGGLPALVPRPPACPPLWRHSKLQLHATHLGVGGGGAPRCDWGEGGRQHHAIGRPAAACALHRSKRGTSNHSLTRPTWCWRGGGGRGALGVEREINEKKCSTERFWKGWLGKPPYPDQKVPFSSRKVPRRAGQSVKGHSQQRAPQPLSATIDKKPCFPPRPCHLGSQRVTMGCVCPAVPRCKWRARAGAERLARPLVSSPPSFPNHKQLTRAYASTSFSHTHQLSCIKIGLVGAGGRGEKKGI